MEPDIHLLASLFPSIAAQLRSTLSTLHFAAAQLAPAAQREQDPALDAKAALLDQSYYQLLRLVNNLSAAAYLHTDAPLPMRDQDIVELVSGLCAQAASLAELAGLELHFFCETPSHVCAIHPEGLEQLLFQLLSNAFKFTPAGGSVHVELKRANNRVLLSVSDTGCGIDEAQLPVLFDRYLHPELMGAHPHGLGLGLPLCHRIAEGMGGRIMAESRLGAGTRFTLSIPDRTLGHSSVSDIAFDYAGGFNRALLALADALPASAFSLRDQG